MPRLPRQGATYAQIPPQGVSIAEVIAKLGLRELTPDEDKDVQDGLNHAYSRWYDEEGQFEEGYLDEKGDRIGKGNGYTAAELADMLHEIQKHLTSILSALPEPGSSFVHLDQHILAKAITETLAAGLPGDPDESLMKPFGESRRCLKQ